ncbi:hypothetical protein EDD16DRAFT_1476933 [Pisolithus croceorrhizus]|nr:hypothetical protein EV401DRAFT_1860640 [Pisolithus croceorrhizus]KAI6122862.1 hypothetical protein EDD16DRAFT_1476933 [Pisolithus croceorrhizus]KAI6169028.1 hypothetical protein EDD17DRAFT_1465288 [Pisolithus thermaeus]
MRIKVTTGPPLPLLKAWFPVPSPHPEMALTSPEFTIANLKTRLCNTLPLGRVPPSSLRLSIDGFELLDECDLGVVRDGDLVCIEQINPPERAIDSKKKQLVRGGDCRKSIPSLRDIDHTSKKRKRPVESTSTSESESTSESDSSSSSSSSSSSYSSTDTDSEETSTTSTSSEESESDTSEPESGPSLPLTTRTERQETKPKPLLHQHTHVPPGFGKPQTRARNKRRRLKRMYNREAAANSGPVSGPNAIETGACTHEESLPQQSETFSNGDTPDVLLLPSLSLRNKNKAKNFRSLINRPLPPKIIFVDEEENGISAHIESSAVNLRSSSVDSSHLASISVEATAERQPLATISRPPLVPPSARPSLPPNLFVTSVDVTAETQRPKKRKKTRATSERANYPVGDLAENTGCDEVPVTLNYGNNEDDGPQEKNLQEQFRRETAPVEVDLNKLEQSAKSNWAQFSKITRETQVNLKVGDVIAYKDLGINPATFTPEYLTTVVKVASVDLTKVVVRLLQPRREVSFSARLGQDVEEAHEEEFEWEHIVNGDWRFITGC